MKTKSIFGLTLTCWAIISAYTVCRIGDLLPEYFQIAYKLKPNEVVAFMHAPTRFATTHTWLFGSAFALITLTTVFTLRRPQANIARIGIVNLCSQGLVAWIALFCYCYEGFCGTMEIRSGSNFILTEFLQFEGGIFLITFLGFAAPLVLLFFALDPAEDK